jgi:hypothetical protein
VSEAIARTSLLNVVPQAKQRANANTMSGVIGHRLGRGIARSIEGC